MYHSDLHNFITANTVFPISFLFTNTQRAFVTAAAAVRGFWIRTSVTKAPVSVHVCQDTLVCSVRTVRRDTSPMAPVVACPAPATPSVQ